ARRLERELARTRAELRELSGIGMALMTERDPDRLLEQIVAKARQLTGSDAGSLYLAEPGDDGAARLRFKLSQNASLPDLPLVSFTLPMDRASLAGHAAVTCQTLRVDDAYHLPADAPYTFNRSFDEHSGYRTRSLLVVPMIDHAGHVVGVLQLINRKDDPAARITSEEAAERHVLPYGDRELELVQALAGQAAVSIENSHLYRQIEELFESFVKAAVIAVDQRDPTTSGHSVRVATLTCDLAETLQRRGAGPYRNVRFTGEQMRELRYAALLHDFGKVGVREEVLVKAKKLPALLLERVLSRFDLIRRTIELEHHRWRADQLERGRSVVGLEDELLRRLAELDRVRAVVLAANEPTVLPEAAAAELEEVRRLTFAGPAGEPLPYVTDEELRFLRIPKGSLDDGERREIESHVEQTYRFLTQIPWTGDLANVAEIAYGHHEKLNGRGYPRGVGGEQIPLQTRIMTVADIFDALTASDRPYKRALPPERALDILNLEAGEGLLDPALVETLVESGVYRRVLEVDWKEL
ncbi:MAG TPA: HD domain-containing phosphohydrolase, partial [Longimicrobiaceae bacterium]|nr:HD domain-containing phosphohydrolase [Longimicrobiaceae bacterium]